MLDSICSWLCSWLCNSSLRDYQPTSLNQYHPTLLNSGCESLLLRPAPGHMWLSWIRINFKLFLFILPHCQLFIQIFKEATRKRREKGGLSEHSNSGMPPPASLVSLVWPQAFLKYGLWPTCEMQGHIWGWVGHELGPPTWPCVFLSSKLVQQNCWLEWFAESFQRSVLGCTRLPTCSTEVPRSNFQISEAISIWTRCHFQTLLQARLRPLEVNGVGHQPGTTWKRHLAAPSKSFQPVASCPNVEDGICPGTVKFGDSCLISITSSLFPHPCL